MSPKLLSLIDSIGQLLQTYLNAMIKIEEVERRTQRTITALVITLAFSVVILMSTWLSLQVLLVFGLLALNFTYFGSALVLFILNLLSLLVLFLCFKKLKRQTKALTNVNGLILCNTLIKAVRKFTSQ